MGPTCSTWVGLNPYDGLGWIEIFFLTHHSGLGWKNSSTQPNLTHTHLYL